MSRVCWLIGGGTPRPGLALYNADGAVLVRRRRKIKKNMRAPTRARNTTPPTTPPAIAPAFVPVVETLEFVDTEEGFWVEVEVEVEDEVWDAVLVDSTVSDEERYKQRNESSDGRGSLELASCCASPGLYLSLVWITGQYTNISLCA